jgi:hypothetical protein
VSLTACTPVTRPFNGNELTVIVALDEEEIEESSITATVSVAVYVVFALRVFGFIIIFGPSFPVAVEVSNCGEKAQV